MRNTLEAIWRGETQQRIYRELVTVMSRPGTVVDLAGVLEGHPAMLGVLATLVDGEVALADPNSLVASSAWPLLEVRKSSVSKANFIVADGAVPPAVEFCPGLGSLSSPDGGATLLLCVESFGTGEQRLTVDGPGVDGTATFQIAGLDTEWLLRREDWVAGFPMGVDVILCSPSHIAAIPRSARVSWKEGR
jgi:alpha-D-ribose 1-methylphosphonate 5-triphosphate synthase subunit PhnH